MSANNSEKEEKPQQENQDYNGESELQKIPQEEEPKEKEVEPLPEENKKLYVKNIPFKTSDEKLQEFFSKYGTVVKAETVKREDGRSLGVGYVEFENVEDKKNVLMLNRNDLVIDGRILDVREDRSQNNIDYSKILYVGNIPFKTTEEGLKKFFNDFCQNLKGNFKVNIQKNYNGSHKGYAYIEFENQEDVESALKANGQKLDDRNLTVEMKRAKEVRPSRGRGRGRFPMRRGYGGRRYDNRRDRDYYYRGERSRSHHRSRERERSRDRDRERERDRDRRREKGDRDRERERYRERGDRDKSDRERERDRDRDRDRDRERDRDRDRDRVRGEREMDRGDRDRDRDRDRSRERRHMERDRGQV